MGCYDSSSLELVEIKNIYVLNKVFSTVLNKYLFSIIILKLVYCYYSLLCSLLIAFIAFPTLTYCSYVRQFCIYLLVNYLSSPLEWKLHKALFFTKVSPALSIVLGYSRCSNKDLLNK